jgi:NADH-quinone oxidoreductase subunit C
METVEQIRDRLLARFPDAAVSVIANPAPAAQHSLLISPAHARAIAEFLRDDSALRLDYCSNVTGVDWPEKEIVESTKTTVADPAGGPPKVIEQKTKRIQPGYLEVVYHLFSMTLKHGPVILRLRTGNRTNQVTLPSLTPVWRACEFQEREVFDLFGVVFRDHPDLREPTPHGVVHDKAKAHYPRQVGATASEPGVTAPTHGPSP